MSNNALLARMRAFGNAVGLMFNGDRDLYNTFGYTLNPTYPDFLAKYSRQDIAARIVEAEPHATWSNPPSLATPNKVFEAAWQDLGIQHKLYSVLNRLDKLSGIGHYGVLVIGFDDGQDLKEPVNSTGASPRSKNLRKVTYMQPYSEGSASITKFVEDPSDYRFGLPEMYKINPQANELVSKVGATSLLARFNPKPFEVHYTRVIHVAENLLEDEVLGNPRLKRVYNLLDDLLKVAGGSAETYWLTANRGLQIDVDKDMDLKESDATALSTEIDEYFHNLRRTIRTKGVKINELGSDVADPRGVFNVIVSLISGGTGIPQRILLGSEAGQLASEQDRANWATRIDERRRLYAEPNILNQLVQTLVFANALPDPGTLAWIWPDAFKMSPLERAQTSAQKARTLANVAKALSDGTSPISVEEGRAIIGLKDVTPIFDSPSDSNLS